MDLNSHKTFNHFRPVVSKLSILYLPQLWELPWQRDITPNHTSSFLTISPYTRHRSRVTFQIQITNIPVCSLTWKNVKKSIDVQLILSNLYKTYNGLILEKITKTCFPPTLFTNICIPSQFALIWRPLVLQKCQALQTALLPNRVCKGTHLKILSRPLCIDWPTEQPRASELCRNWL